MKNFISRQIAQIKQKGFSEVKRKFFRLRTILHNNFYLVVYFPFAITFILFMRLIRPFFLIRIQPFIYWRLGHYAGNTELYLCEQDAKINVPDKPYFDIWYQETNDSNLQLKKMWSRVLHVWPGRFMAIVDRTNLKMGGGDIHQIGMNTYHDRDVNNLLDKIPAHLSFTESEEIQGKKNLELLGIPADAKFVCLIVRDSAFLNNQSTKAHLTVDWSYHNYRDCNVQNYIMAAEELTKRGYYVIRMGALVKEAMNVSNPKIIDYAMSGKRTDFMDIYLGAKCAFCITNGTGFDAVPLIFRRPIVWIDQVAMGFFFTFSNKFLAITKKHWSRKEKRFLTVKEIFESGAGYFYRSKEFDSLGIDLIESTPEETCAAVLEIEERISGKWQTTKEDEELQRRFWEVYDKKNMHGEIRSRVGADFLRRNKFWLE